MIQRTCVAKAKKALDCSKSLVMSTENEPFDSSIHQAPGAHRAWFDRRINSRSGQPIIADGAAASRKAMISAWAVGSLSVMVRLAATANSWPSSSTGHAPIGTSSRLALHVQPLRERSASKIRRICHHEVNYQKETKSICLELLFNR